MKKLALIAVVMCGLVGCAGSQFPECVQYPPDMDYARVVAVEQRASRWAVILDWHGYRTEVPLPNKQATTAFPPVSDSILMHYFESDSYSDYTSVVYVINCLDNNRRRVVFICRVKN